MQIPPPFCLSSFVPVVHVTKVRPLADRVREVQLQMSAALLTGSDSASVAVEEEPDEHGDNGGSKRGREHIGRGQ
jgi:hypothetical protein